MALLTTTIGSYPKPESLSFLEWTNSETMSPTGISEDYELFLRGKNKEFEGLVVDATRRAILDQVNVGIDILTDGEMGREDYTYYHCRHLKGVDFSSLAVKTVRAGARKGEVPTIRGKISARGRRFLTRDWVIAQSFTNKPVKVTVPGPMTVADTLADKYYHDERRLCEDIANALNVEIRALAKMGCRYIQIDEPVFARYPDKALAYGVDNLERCFHRVPRRVMRLMHMCCGYPERLDQEDYLKADPSVCFELAGPLNDSSIDTVSIEDAHRHNDLSLLERFSKTKVMLGVVAIARSRIESREEIKKRLEAALNHIEAARLIAAPDCGLSMLDRDTALAKLTSLVSAARTTGS